MNKNYQILIPILVVLVVLTGLLVGLHRPVQALNTVWTVCPLSLPECDFNVIQQAVDAAADGDVIQIAEGVYSEVNRLNSQAQIVYLNKSVTLRGGYTVPFTEPPDPLAHPTILDAKGKGRVFFIEYSAPTLEGLIITGGNSKNLGGTPYDEDAGGGIYLWGSSLTLKNSIVTGNKSTVDGGGIYMRMYSSPIIMDSVISDNTAMYGAGIYIWTSYPTITRSSILENHGEGSGGVWMGVNSEGRFEYNYFAGNTATGTSNETGGGLLAERSTIILNGNQFHQNVAHAGGGGAVLIRCDATLTNNIFAENQVETSGGSLLLNGTTALLIHNTVVRSLGTQTSGIYLATHWEPVYSTATIINTILVGNPIGIYVELNNSANLEGTLWGSGEWANGLDLDGPGLIETGVTNLWDDPLFVNALEGDYHINLNSPAINIGLPSQVSSDIDGEPRPMCCLPDLGADEVKIPCLYDFLPLVVKQ